MSLQFDLLLENQFAVPPQVVWDTVATSEGNLCWLYPLDIEPRLGGNIARGPSKVGAWEPPHRFVLTHQSEGLDLSMEYQIKDDGAGGSHLRTYMLRIHDNMDEAQLAVFADCARRHGVFYHDNLERYLGHFAGQAATLIQLDGPEASKSSDAFSRLKQSLGLPDQAAAGDRLTLDLPGLPQQAVTVDYHDAYFLGLRTETGLYRFFGRNAWNAAVAVNLHLFDPTLDKVAVTAVWQTWLAQLYGQAA